MKKGKIICREKIADIDFSRYDDYVIVKHDTVKEKIKNEIIFSDFKIKYADLNDRNKILLVGAERMITPSNRCNFINDYLSVMTRDKEKIAICTNPFISEGWRCYWLFQMCNLDDDVFGVNYSYPVERNYYEWLFNGKEDVYFSEKFLMNSTENIDTKLNKLNTNIQYYDVDNLFYEELKKHLLEKHNTIRSYVNELIDLCNKKYEVDYDFNNLGVSLMLPNLKIYRLIEKENLRQEKIYNAFAL
jgi:hypothetical protein